MHNVVHVHVAKYMYSVHVRKILLACETRYKCTCTCIVRSSHVYYSNTLEMAATKNFQSKILRSYIG